MPLPFPSPVSGNLWGRMAMDVLTGNKTFRAFPRRLTALEFMFSACDVRSSASCLCCTGGKEREELGYDRHGSEIYLCLWVVWHRDNYLVQASRDVCIILDKNLQQPVTGWWAHCMPFCLWRRCVGRGSACAAGSPAHQLKRAWNELFVSKRLESDKQPWKPLTARGLSKAVLFGLPGFTNVCAVFMIVCSIFGKNR